MPLASRRALLSALLFAITLVATPSSAHAHVGIETDPPSGSRLAAAPKSIELSFSEPLDPSLVHVKLIAASNQEEVAITISGQDGAPEDTLQITPKASMPDGSYTVSVQALGSDGHTVRSDASFVIGNGPLVKHSPDTGSSAQGLRGASTKAGSILGLASLLGSALVFTSLLVGLSSHQLWKSVIRAAQISAAVGGVGALLTFIAYDPPSLASTASLADQLTATVSTPFGKLLLLRIAALAALALTAPWILRISSEDPRRRSTLENSLVIIGFVLAFSFAGSSHAAADDWSFTTLLVALIHLSAAALWLTGLFGLTFLAHRGRLPEVSPDMIRRFGQLAGWCAAAATTSGLLLAFRLTNGLDPSSLKTPYGAALAGKVAMVGVLLLCALLTHRGVRFARLIATPAASPLPVTAGQTAVVPRTEAVTAQRVRRRLKLEASAAAAVLTLANVLAAWAGRI